MITEQENTIQSVASVQTFSIKSEIRHSNAQGTLVISVVLSFIRPFLEGDFGQQQHREVQESVALKANETLSAWHEELHVQGIKWKRNYWEGIKGKSNPQQVPSVKQESNYYKEVALNTTNNYYKCMDFSAEVTATSAWY